MSRRSAIGIITAAGRGERAGGPKALARDGSGRSLAVAHAEALLAGGVDEVLVVARRDVAAQLVAELPRGARTVVSDAPDDEGPAGSIRAACSATDPARRPDVALVTPVDKRPAEVAVVRALIAAVRAGAEAAKASHQGRGGHPVAIRWETLAAMGAGVTLRDILGACRDVVALEGGATALDDLDDAAALRTAGYSSSGSSMTSSISTSDGTGRSQPSVVAGGSVSSNER